MTFSKHRLVALLMICLAMSFGASPANASSYIGLDGTSLTIDNSVDKDINPRGLRLRLGTRVSRFFDLEAQFGGGSDETTRSFDELSAAYLGIYLKGYLPVGRRSAFYALAGPSSVELTQTIGRGKFSDSRAGFSYGVGLETALFRFLDLSADFIRYTLDDDEFSELSAVNLGIKLYF